MPDCITSPLLGTSLQPAEAGRLLVQALDATMSVIVQHLSHLHKLIDNIALLDMLLCLATVVNRSSDPYVAPQCTQSGEPAA